METTSDFWHPLAPTATTHAAPPTSSRPHVLVFDSDPAVLELYREALEEAGYVPLLSPAPLSPATILRLRPDLIVLEWRLNGTDGRHLLRRWRSDPALTRIPVVVCTGALDWLPAMAAELAKWRVPVVAKPFDLDNLLEAIQMTLGRAPRADVAASWETAVLTPRDLARLHDQYVAARWRGEDVAAFGDWLDAHWSRPGPSEPDVVPDAVSFLGGSGSGGGPRWYRRDGAILGFVPGHSRGYYRIPETATQPALFGRRGGPAAVDLVLRVEDRDLMRSSAPSKRP